MDQFYMDTNVFISGLKPDDPFHAESTTIAKGLKRGEMRAETSVLALLEVAAVSGRLYDSKKRRGANNDRHRKVFILKALRTLAGLRVRFVNMAGDAPLWVRGIQADLPSVFNDAILLSLETSLRSLDLIHLAAARHAKRVNDELGAFITGDREFLRDKAALSAMVGMPILSPREYVEGAGLSVPRPGGHASTRSR